MDYHAHALLDMMEGKTFTDESLLAATLQQFGVDATFHTCSIQGQSAQEIITFLKNKGKFIDVEGGYTVNTAARCHH